MVFNTLDKHEAVRLWFANEARNARCWHDWAQLFIFLTQTTFFLFSGMAVAWHGSDDEPNILQIPWIVDMDI